MLHLGLALAAAQFSDYQLQAGSHCEPWPEHPAGTRLTFNVESTLIFNHTSTKPEFNHLSIFG